MSPPVTLRPRRKSRSLAQELVGIISERIRTCAILPGDKLPTESEIVAEYKVSRTVVREAISSLQAAGLVETRHGIGTFVLDAPKGLDLRIDPNMIVTVRDVLAVLELRIVLETEAAALAAARRTEDQLAEMRRALDTFQADLERDGDTAMPDYQFHLQIAYATGNRYFADIMSHLGMATIPRTRLAAVQSQADKLSYLGLVQRQHTEIYEAVLRRDPEGARAAMRAHLTSSRNRLRRAHDAAEAQYT